MPSPLLFASWLDQLLVYVWALIAYITSRSSYLLTSIVQSYQLTSVAQNIASRLVANRFAALPFPTSLLCAGLLDQLLASLPAAVAGSPSLQLSEEAMTLAGRLLRWPAAQLFPGLDIARCLVLHPAAASAFAAGAGSMATPVLGTLSGALAAAAVSELSPALQTALRLAVNCFKQQAVRSWVLDNRELILDGFAGCCAAGGPGSNKGVRLSMATLLLNYAVAAAAGTPGGASSSSSSGGEGSVQLLSGLEELIGSCPVEEVDSIHRAVLALGTLMVGPGGGVNGELVGLAKDLGLNGQLQRFSGVGGKVSAAVQEVGHLLR